MRGLGSIPTGGNILSLDFFHIVRVSDANIGNYCLVCLFVKNLIDSFDFQTVTAGMTYGNFVNNAIMMDYE